MVRGAPNARRSTNKGAGSLIGRLSGDVSPAQAICASVHTDTGKLILISLNFSLVVWWGDLVVCRLDGSFDGMILVGQDRGP